MTTTNPTRDDVRPATGSLRLVRGKRGDVWYARLRRDGRQTDKRIGPAWTKRGRCPDGHLTEAAANARLHDILTSPQADGRETIRHTFADACDAFLRHREHDKGIAETTLRSYRITVEKTLRPHFGADTPIDDIDEDAVVAFRSALLENPALSRNTARHHMILLFGVLERARIEKWIPANPSADVERIRIPRASGAYKALTPDQVIALGAAASDVQYRTLFIVAAFTGLRMGELRALRWTDIDYVNAIVHVQRNRPSNGTTEKRPKSGKVRSVPLLDQVARELDALSRRERFTAPDDHVFINTFGGPLHDDTIRAEWETAMQDAELGHLRSKDVPVRDRFTFHDLRHTFGTIGARMWPLSELQGYMGHADITTTMVYVHHVPRVKAAAEASAYIAAQLGADAETSPEPAESTGSVVKAW